MVLPYALLIPVLQELKISMLEVNNRDIVVVKERMGGLARPYVGTDLQYNAEVMRLKERILQTEMAYAAVKDDITNYKEKKVLFDAAKNKVNHKTKEHPHLTRCVTGCAILIPSGATSRWCSIFPTMPW
jgi:beta-glucosidase-like glycosyl hydrolase